MSIIGATVGTTLSPSKIEEKINPVKSVNNQLPDENGNVNVEVNGNGNITETDPTVPAWAKQPTKPSYTNSEVGLGNVDNVKQYSASNPPPYPVTSVNGKTGVVTLGASDVGARPNTWTPTYSDVGADKSGTASTSISSHNTNTSAHNDLRLLIEGLSTRLNALANSTDDDLDQMAEVVAYIKANKQLIDSVTTSKVSVADIVDNLSTNVTNRPLSAAQGVALKALIDAITVPTKVSELANDAKYLTSFTETDPTVPSWAKQSTKPSYSKSEVGLGNVDNVKQYSANNPPPYPVTSVNSKTGAVSLSASDVGARPSTWTPSAAEVGADKSGTASSAVSAHNSNTSAHADIRTLISKLSSENVPDYIVTEAEDVANKVLSVRNAYSFVFGAISDIHSTGSDASTLHAGQGIREIDKLTNLDACLNFGDGIDSYFENINADSFLHIHRCLHSVQREIPYIQLQGNHDQLKTDTTEDAQQKYFAYIGANNIGTVTDWGNRFRNYGYRDFPDQRMRVIYLNSVDVSEGENTDDCWLTAMQLSWLVNTALDFTDKEGWAFIVGCHHPLNWWYMDNLLTILNAYKGKASGSVAVNGTTVAYNFTNATAEFIAHFHGHLHNFRVETLGTNDVLSITIPNACFGRNNEYGTSSSYTDEVKANYGDVDENGDQRQFNKTSGTAEDTAFNVVVVDRENRKIHCFNYGAGIDREVDFTGNVVVPDEPDEPIIPDEPEEIVNILNTIGYTDGKRCKTSSISLGDLSGATAFGWYDCSNLTPTDVIRIYLPNGVPTEQTQAYAAHVTSADETTSQGMGYYYQGSLDIFGNMFASVSYADNIITLTGRITSSSKTKFRLSAQANGADCIMTLNQEIVV